MAVDGTTGVDDDAEKGEEQRLSGWRLPPADRPGTESPGLSRADSRAGAAAANNMRTRSAADMDTCRPEAIAPSDQVGEIQESDAATAETTACVDKDLTGPSANAVEATNGAALRTDRDGTTAWRDVEDGRSLASATLSEGTAETHNEALIGVAQQVKPSRDEIAPNRPDEELGASTEPGVASRTELKERTEFSGNEATEECISPEAGRPWHTVADEQGEVCSYASFEAARKDLGARPGRELHHVVEQGQASPERSGFSIIRINSTDNLVHLPADVHTEVSRHYSSRPRGFEGSVRDNLNGEPWDDQYRYGQKAIDEAWKKVRSEHD